MQIVALACCTHLCAATEEGDFFEKRVRPVLVERCYKCHSSESEKVKGGLLLDSPDGWLKGGEHGPAKSSGCTSTSYVLVQGVVCSDRRTTAWHVRIQRPWFSRFTGVIDGRWERSWTVPWRKDLRERLRRGNYLRCALSKALDGRLWGAQGCICHCRT